jgi:predicted transcriptional regulator
LGKVLVLEVTFFEDAAEGLRESVASLAPSRRQKRPDIAVRRINADAARQLLTWPMLTILRAIRRRRPQSITALANAVDRDAAGVKTDLTVLERLGIIALRDGGRKGGPKVPHALYETIQLRVAI